MDHRHLDLQIQITLEWLQVVANTFKILLLRILQLTPLLILLQIQQQIQLKIPRPILPVTQLQIQPLTPLKIPLQIPQRIQQLIQRQIPLQILRKIPQRIQQPILRQILLQILPKIRPQTLLQIQLRTAQTM